jgi:hypothetical protein
MYKMHIRVNGHRYSTTGFSTKNIGMVMRGELFVIGLEHYILSIAIYNIQHNPIFGRAR